MPHINHMTTSDVRVQISGWACILMTNSHSSRVWNTLYMYEIDLLWVRRGWAATEETHVKNQQNLLLRCFTTLRVQISGWGCILRTNSHSSRGWNTLYMYEIDLLWVLRGWGATEETNVKNHQNLLLRCFTTFWVQISGWGCILRTNSHSSKGWNTLYICMK